MKKQSDYNTDLEGIEFLRNLVNWANYRAEFKNENKTPIQLINEFCKELF